MHFVVRTSGFKMSWRHTHKDLTQRGKCAQAHAVWKQRTPVRVARDMPRADLFDFSECRDSIAS
jgi:hypothetical protein